MKTNTQTWELVIDHIPYRWTHFVFAWSEKSGIQLFKNGNWRSQSLYPTANKDQFTRKEPSKRLFVGKHYETSDTVLPQVFQLMDLFVVKRKLLPSDISSFIYKGKPHLFLQS